MCLFSMSAINEVLQSCLLVSKNQGIEPILQTELQKRKPILNPSVLITKLKS